MREIKETAGGDCLRLLAGHLRSSEELMRIFIVSRSAQVTTQLGGENFKR